MRKTSPERRHCFCSGIFIVNFKHISHVILVFLLLTLSWYIFARKPCYGPLSTLEQNDVIALLSLLLILNIFHNLLLGF